MVISRIVRKRGRSPVFNVSVNGARAFELSDEVLDKYDLRVGVELTESLVEKILTAEAETRARRLALNYVSYRPRSAKEVTEHLVRKGFARTVAGPIVRRLQELDLVNDLKFAHMYAREKLRKKPMGRALLRHALNEKGIAPQIIEEVLDAYLTEKEQLEAAATLAATKLRQQHDRLGKLHPAKRRRRMTDYLLRRGFSTDIAVKTVRDLVP